MCGRFSRFTGEDVLINRFGVDRKTISNFEDRYNIAPSQDVEVIYRENPIVLGQMHWGFIPYWAKSKHPEIKPINARKDSLDKKMFQRSFQRYRCIIPASGFFEWKKSGNNKIPHHITVKDSDIFGMAGIVSTWKPSRNSDPFHSFAIITTEPNEMMSEIHDRMPAILTRDAEKTWLDKDSNTSELLDILQPYPHEMVAYPVSTYVNSPRNTGKKCIEPTDDPLKEEKQGSLDDYF